MRLALPRGAAWKGDEGTCSRVSPWSPSSLAQPFEPGGALPPGSAPAAGLGPSGTRSGSAARNRGALVRPGGERGCSSVPNRSRLLRSCGVTEHSTQHREQVGINKSCYSS